MMARRKFTLPGIHELSKEQEDARLRPKRGQHLTIGGPGTGKSVLALLRSRRHQGDKEAYVFLVSNKLLDEASRHLLGTNLTSNTWNKMVSGYVSQEDPRACSSLAGGSRLDVAGH